MKATETDVEVLVIGIGNPLRGDDAVGWFAAQWLAERVDPDRVIAMALHQLTPEWAEALSRAKMVIFIDAAEGQAPGTISIEEIYPSDSSPAMTHEMSPQGLLAFLGTLHHRTPRAYLCTVGGSDFGHKEELSAPVEAACEELVQRVDDMIQNVMELEEQLQTHA